MKKLKKLSRLRKIKEKKLLKFRNDRSDIINPSYSSVFPVIDRSNKSSLQFIDLNLKYLPVDEETMTVMDHTLNIDEDSLLNYLDDEKVRHELLIEMINIDKATEMEELKKEIEMLEAHIKKNSILIEKLKEENLNEECEQEDVSKGIQAAAQGQFA